MAKDKEIINQAVNYDIEAKLKTMGFRAGAKQINAVNEYYKTLIKSTDDSEKAINQAAKAFAQGNKKLKKAQETQENMVKSLNKTYSGLASKIKSFAKNLVFSGTVGIGFVDTLKELDKTTLKVAASVSGMGFSFKDVTSAMKTANKNLSVTRKGALELFETYSQGIYSLSEGDFSGITKNIENVMGAGTDGAKQMLQAINEVKSAAPGLNFTDLSQKNKKNLRSVVNLLYTQEKISSSVFSMTSAYLDQEKEVSKELVERTKTFGEFKKLSEDVALGFAKMLIPAFEKLSQWFKENRPTIEEFFKKVQKWVTKNTTSLKYLAYAFVGLKLVQVSTQVMGLVNSFRLLKGSIEAAGAASASSNLGAVASGGGATRSGASLFPSLVKGKTKGKLISGAGMAAAAGTTATVTGIIAATYAAYKFGKKDLELAGDIKDLWTENKKLEEEIANDEKGRRAKKIMAIKREIKATEDLIEKKKLQKELDDRQATYRSKYGRPKSEINAEKRVKEAKKLKQARKRVTSSTMTDIKLVGNLIKKERQGVKLTAEENKLIEKATKNRSDLFKSQAQALDNYVKVQQTTGEMNIAQAKERVNIVKENIQDIIKVNKLNQERVKNNIRNQKSQLKQATTIEDRIAKEQTIVSYQKDLTNLIAEESELKSKSLEISNKHVEVYNMRLDILSKEAGIAKGMVSLMDNFAMGVGASAEMRMKAVDAVQNEINMLEKQRRQQQIILSQNSNNETAKNKLLELEGKILNKQQEQAGMLKTLRDGWVEAIGAMNTGAGRYTKIIMNAQKNTAGLVAMGAELSAYSGSLRGGYRRGTKYSTNALGGFSSPQIGVGGRQGGEAYRTRMTALGANLREAALRKDIDAYSRIMGKINSQRNIRRFEGQSLLSQNYAKEARGEGVNNRGWANTGRDMQRILKEGFERENYRNPVVVGRRGFSNW